MNLQPRTRRTVRPLLPQKIILEIRWRNSTIRANLAAHVHVPRTRMWVCHASVNTVHHSLRAYVFRYFLHTLSHLLPPPPPPPITRVEDTTQSDKQIYFSRVFCATWKPRFKGKGNRRGVLHNARNARTRRFHFSRKLNSPSGVRAKERAKTNPRDC